MRQGRVSTEVILQSTGGQEKPRMSEWQYKLKKGYIQLDGVTDDIILRSKEKELKIQKYDLKE